MMTPNWFSAVTVFMNGMAVLINAFIAVRWGKEFARAKEAQIEMLRTHLEIYKPGNMLDDVQNQQKYFEHKYARLTQEINDVKEELKGKDIEIEILKNKSNQPDLKTRENSQQVHNYNVDSFQENIDRLYQEKRDLKIKQSNLSDRQKKILEFIKFFSTNAGYSPTIREIGQSVDISSTSVVNYNLNVLARTGFILRDKTISRGIQLN